MAKRNIKPPQPNKSKISLKAVAISNKEHEPEYPVFQFKHVCENHCKLSQWQGNELLELIKTFQNMELVPWSELGRHGGLRLKKIDRYSKPLPPKVSPDVTIYEVRVCEKKRVFGYRSDNIFRVLWFDREHEVVPYHKQRRA